MTVLEKKKAAKDNKVMRMIKGFMILISETPADLKAISSWFSAMLPMVIIEESSTAKGRASGIMLADA